MQGDARRWGIHSHSGCLPKSWSWLDDTFGNTPLVKLKPPLSSLLNHRRLVDDPLRVDDQIYLHVCNSTDMSYQIISYHGISYHIISFHFISFHGISDQIRSYQIRSYHLISIYHHNTSEYHHMNRPPTVGANSFWYSTTSEGTLFIFTRTVSALETASAPQLKPSAGLLSHQWTHRFRTW